ncbi:MAG: hypothetical protein JW940_17870 [Polyangiaceae bacterium]|nr:hypothetical protein [Polyangiaceae bacterium]
MVPASVLGLMSPSSCTTSGVVGGDCRSGLSWCDGDCVDLQTDEHNCGRCGHECRSGVTCRDGVCGGSRDGSAEAGANAGGQGSSADAGQGNDKDGGQDAEGDVFGEWDASWDGGHAAAGGVGGEYGTGGRHTGGSAGSGASGGRHTAGGAGGNDSTGGQGGAGATGGQGGAGATGGQGGTGATGGRSGADAGSGNVANAGAGGSGCIPPFRTADQCGDCYTACRGSTPVCSPVDGEYQCVPRCEDPLVDCSGQCVDLQSNPDHCGKCGHRCPSRLCQAGTCVGAQAGDIILACMNLESMADQQNVLLGNSVFRQITAVRILSYEQYASTRAVDRVANAIESIAAGRPYSLDVADSSQQVVQDLNVIDFDVLIVHDQPDAPEGTLSSIGSAWAETLDSFTRAGGTVLVLSSTDGVDEMYELITDAGLSEIDGARSVTGTRLANAAPGDAIGNGVLNRFLALPETCAFDTPLVADAANIIVVTTDPNQEPIDPVVIHRVVSP